MEYQLKEEIINRLEQLIDSIFLISMPILILIWFLLLFVNI